MIGRTMSYAELAAALRERRPSERALLVCMDGAGGSGKSTIARGLAAAAGDIQVIAQDDFYRPKAARYSGPLSLLVAVAPGCCRSWRAAGRWSRAPRCGPQGSNVDDLGDAGRGAR
jgi:hypothetical protein